MFLWDGNLSPLKSTIFHHWRKSHHAEFGLAARVCPSLQQENQVCLCNGRSHSLSSCAADQYGKQISHWWFTKCFRQPLNNELLPGMNIQSHWWKRSPALAVLHEQHFCCSGCMSSAPWSRSALCQNWPLSVPQMSVFHLACGIPCAILKCHQFSLIGQVKALVNHLIAK